MRLLDYKLFHRAREGEKFVLAISASDFDRGDRWPSVTDLLSDRTLDIGVRLTGREVSIDFVVVKVSHDADADVEYWELEPTRESRELVPSCVNTKMFIYND